MPKYKPSKANRSKLIAKAKLKKEKLAESEKKEKVAESEKKLPPGVCFTKTGKVKRDRYSVYYGYHPKTKGGLTKDDFIKKGNKIISKKKSELGKLAIKNLR